MSDLLAAVVRRGSDECSLGGQRENEPPLPKLFDGATSRADGYAVLLGKGTFPRQARPWRQLSRRNIGGYGVGDLPVHVLGGCRINGRRLFHDSNIERRGALCIAG